MTQDTLPYSGSTPQSRATSRAAAAQACEHRGEQTRRYILALRAAPYFAGRNGLTDHEAAEVIRVPLSSICSIRNALVKRGEVVATDETRLSPFGRVCVVWRVR